MWEFHSDLVQPARGRHANEHSPASHSELSEHYRQLNARTQILQVLHSLPKLNNIIVETSDFWSPDVYEQSSLIDYHRILEASLRSITFFLQILGVFLLTKSYVQLSLKHIDLKQDSGEMLGLLSDTNTVTYLLEESVAWLTMAPDYEMFESWTEHCV